MSYYDEEICKRSGRAAANSNDPEPQCPYMPGSKAYSWYADGFCEVAIDRENVRQANEQQLFS